MISKIFSLFLFAFFGLFHLNCKKTSSTEVSQTQSKNDRLVIADGGLHLRETPDQNGKSIFLIPNYSTVQFIEEIGEKKEINGYSSKWNKISFGDKTGYAYGAFLNSTNILATDKNPKGNLYFKFYTIQSDANPSDKNDCTQNYMAFGCVVAIYKTEDNSLLTAFEGKITYHWIDNDRIAEEWIIGDAGYAGFGVRAINIHTKEESDIWKREEMISMGDPSEKSTEFNRLCLQSNCIDLSKNSDLLSQLKSNPKIKFYPKSTYKEKIDVYSTQISIDDNNFLNYIPSKNIIIEE